MSPPDKPAGDADGPRRRRRRYSGTHPKGFGDKYKEFDPDSYPGLQDHVRAQGRTPAGTHIPVLLGEVLAALDPRPGEVVADCTLGYGGHAMEFLRRIIRGGTLIGLDVDAEQIERTRDRLVSFAALLTQENPGVTGVAPSVRIHRSHFAGLGKVLARGGIGGCDVILADLGVSSMQIDDPARGFSYKHDGPLDMRMDDRLVRTAADVLASLSGDELGAALAELGEEPDAARIAEEVLRRRRSRPLMRTQQLVDLVLEVKGLTRRAWRERGPERRSELHPAARTFQALRILVNDELSGLSQFLRIVPYCLRPGGRVGVISFHSGEDLLVEAAFREGQQSQVYTDVSEPIRPSVAEVGSNPRSRSAVFRWARRSSS